MAEKTQVLYSRSAYAYDKPHTSKQQDTVHQHPCVNNIGEADNITDIWWSNTNTNGHFGIPKVIFGRLGYGIYIDAVGGYGMSHGCFGIVDNPDNLENIKKILKTEAFKDIMGACNAGGLRENYNYKVIALFRKDFWKDFINE